jgi:GNAT superfamily N-acetyltransferase
MISPIEERELDELKGLVAVTVRQCVADSDEDATFLIEDIVLSLNTWWTSGSKGLHTKYSVDDAIVGFVIVKEFCILSHLFVLPQHQGCGIGRMLLENAVSACRGRSPSKKIRLNSSSSASAFYAAMGFRQTGPGIERPGGCIPYECDL